MPNNTSQSPDMQSQIGSTRVSCYLRVSTTRQAGSDLSIPDQRKKLQSFCDDKGWSLVAEYVEPGASATDDNRPEFQKMIERACDGDHPFDVILVHSYSRFFREAFGLEMYLRRLAKAGVRLVSATQELGDDPAQVMMRQIIAMFDEYQSRENAKHVLRAMKENAIQGFCNGARPPLGYKTQEVEQRANRTKKRLVIDLVEAETVRLIFRLYTHGDGTSGALGIKKLTSWLNDRGYRTRTGARFGVASIHTILTNRVYIGDWVFNRRDSKTLLEKPKSEQISIAVPAIIDHATFETVAKTLQARDPRVTAPRVVTGPILLTGLATCATCGGAMTLRTGTSRSGEVHRYYSCSTSGRMGKSACRGRAIRMDTLDALVTDNLVEQLLRPDRLTATLSSLWASRAQKASEVDGRVAVLQAEAQLAEDKLKRLYSLIEEGLTELDDILGERLASLKVERDRARTALDRIRIVQQPPAIIGPELIEQFGELMRANVTDGEIPFRKAWLRAVVDRIEVDDTAVRIVGDKTSLERAVAESQTGAMPAVRSFERKWRTRHDSNV
ncbi:recombinase family protein [Methylobacterium sp. 275MFSha3.1]|uniref:recombinase family protein n=1 Tax=Methylobacterium sp. 275MFSha3.1 TaxID=1502746 RepID=UPI000AAB1411|nr:recombinase family protein [Methylobacterium sp. 275MFSha3.1]